jgi:hypothetical protein
MMHRLPQPVAVWKALQSEGCGPAAGQSSLRATRRPERHPAGARAVTARHLERINAARARGLEREPRPPRPRIIQLDRRGGAGGLFRGGTVSRRCPVLDVRCWTVSCPGTSSVQEGAR